MNYLDNLDLPRKALRHRLWYENRDKVAADARNNSSCKTILHEDNLWSSRRRVKPFSCWMHESRYIKPQGANNSESRREREQKLQRDRSL